MELEILSMMMLTSNRTKIAQKKCNMSTKLDMWTWNCIRLGVKAQTTIINIPKIFKGLQAHQITISTKFRWATICKVFQFLTQTVEQFLLIWIQIWPLLDGSPQTILQCKINQLWSITELVQWEEAFKQIINKCLK